MSRPIVVVISSHVAKGSVGNRAMVPVLEAMGYDVWAIPTVLLPYHPGQGQGVRVALDAGDFGGILDNLARREEIQRVKAIISGYLGSVQQVSEVVRFVQAVRHVADCHYVCDPVIGDAHGLYVSQPQAEAIRDMLVPIADLITPNRFEHAWLAGDAGIVHHDLEQTVALASRLPAPVQIVTSALAGDKAKRKTSIGNLFIDCRRQRASACMHARLESVPNGTGDLFTAAFCGFHLTGLGDELRRATRLVLGAIARTPQGDDLRIAADYQSVNANVNIPEITMTEWTW